MIINLMTLANLTATVIVTIQRLKSLAAALFGKDFLIMSIYFCLKEVVKLLRLCFIKL